MFMLWRLCLVMRTDALSNILKLNNFEKNGRFKIFNGLVGCEWGCLQAQSGGCCGQDLGNATSYGPPRVLPDHTSLFFKGLDQKGSPPWRDDDKDGHYMFAVGDNLTPRCNYTPSLGFHPF